MYSCSTLQELITQVKEGNQGITFVRSAKEEYFVSYRDVYKLALESLHRLRKAGIREGQEAVFQLDDPYEFIVMFWACVLGKVIPVPVSIGTTEDVRHKLKAIWERLIDPVLIMPEDEYAQLSEFCDNHAEFQQWGSHLQERTLHSAALVQPFEQLGAIEESLENLALPQAQKTDIAFIQFSSGSTGAPKGVVLTHGNLISNMSAIVSGSKATEQDTSLSWMPLTHDMGLIGFHLTPVLANMNQIMMPPALFIQRPAIWLNKASEHQVSVLASPNFGYKHLLSYFQRRRKEKWDLSQVRLIFNGAEPISADLCEAFLEEMAPFGLKPEVMFPVYGMAEASLAVTFPPVEETLQKVQVHRSKLAIGSKVTYIDAGDQGPETTTAESEKQSVTFVDVGTAVQDCEIQICDDSDQPLEEGHIGHILIRGDNVTTGYYRADDINARTFTDQGWLRTGDLGFIHQGRLVITGRFKDIIFINGQNVYPHDLEQLAEQLDEVDLGRIAICGLYQAERGSDEVVAFVIHRGDLQRFVPVMQKLKQAIWSQTGIELSKVIPVKSIPKTTSGKIQRYQCAEAYRAGEYESVLEELDRLTSAQQEQQADLEEERTRTSTELQLLELWSDLTGEAPPTSVHQPFYELGIHSLKAASLIGRIREQFRIELQLRDFFQTGTLHQLAAFIDQAERMDETSSVSHYEGTDYPLSPAQTRVYWLEQMEDIHYAYHIPMQLNISGKMDAEELRKVFHTLTQIHPILRMQVRVRDGQPYQVRNDDAQLQVEFENCAQTLASLDEQWQSFLRPFDLANAPLFRARLLSHSNDQHTLLLDAHHLMLDGISMNLLIQDFQKCLNDEQVETSEIHFGDYAKWLEQTRSAQSEEQDASRNFWKQELQGELPLLQLPYDKTRPEQRTYKGATWTQPVSDELKQKLQQAAKKLACNESSLYYAAFVMLLSRFSGQKQFVTGLLTSGRTSLDTETMLGMFNAFLPLKADVSDDFTLVEWTRQLQEQLIAIMDHQSYPLEQMLDDIAYRADRSRNPLFDTMLIYHNQMEQVHQFEAKGRQFTHQYVHNRAAKLDLKLDLFPGQKGTLDGIWEYNTQLFHESTIQRMADAYCWLLEQIAAASPEQKVTDLQLLRPEEQQHMMESWNRTEAPFPDQHLLHERFEEQVARHPQRQAISFGHESLTYAELNARSNRLARYLQQHGVEPDSWVAILSPRKLDMMIGIFAVLKAGGAYVPISPDFPEDRIAYMLEDSGASLVLRGCQTDIPSQIDASERMIIDLDDDAPWRELDESNLSRSTAPDKLAYMIYTSGSTGKPKGTMIEHRAVINRLHWMQ
ncbi:AMP-binding protein, partial [Marinicrinis sediminis]